MQFINLKAQQRQIEDKIKQRIHKVLDHCQFVLGPEVKELEETLAAMTLPKGICFQPESTPKNDPELTQELIETWDVTSCLVSTLAMGANVDQRQKSRRTPQSSGFFMAFILFFLTSAPASLPVIFLQALDLRLPGFQLLDGLGHGLGPGHGGRVRNAIQERGLTQLLGVLDGLSARSGVDHQRDLAVLDLVQDVGAALPDLEHGFAADALLS